MITLDLNRGAPNTRAEIIPKTLKNDGSKPDPGNAGVGRYVKMIRESPVPDLFNDILNLRSEGFYYCSVMAVVVPYVLWAV